MKKLMLGAALLTGAACGQAPTAIRVGTTTTPEGTTTTAAPSTTVAPTTTTAVLQLEPEPIQAETNTTVPYVAPPVTTRRAPATTVYEPPSPQSRTVEPAGDIWWQLALCEDGGRNRDFGPYSGYFHFLPSTYHAYGGVGQPSANSYEAQLAVAQRLQAAEGWWPWPGCKAKLGL